MKSLFSVYSEKELAGGGGGAVVLEEDRGRVWLFFPVWEPVTSVWSQVAAKSLQLCPTLCDPIDGSPPASPVPGILQARTLEWVEVRLGVCWWRQEEHAGCDEKLSRWLMKLFAPTCRRLKTSFSCWASLWYLKQSMSYTGQLRAQHSGSSWS